MQSGLFSQLQSSLYFAAAAMVNPKAINQQQRFEPLRVRTVDPYATGGGNFRTPQFKTLYSLANRFL